MVVAGVVDGSKNAPAHAQWGTNLTLALLVIVVSRIGLQIPLPGIDPGQIGAISIPHWSGTNPLARVSLFALGLTPYISAWVLVEVFRGRQSEREVERIRLWLTVGFTLFQGWGIATALEQIRVPGGWLVLEPGPLFRATAILTLTASTLCLVWLGGQITRLGIANGIWLLYAVEIVAQLPMTLLAIHEMARMGGVTAPHLMLLAALCMVSVGLVVLIERAWCDVEIERRDGTRDMLSFRIDRATIIPGVVAGWVMSLLVTASQLLWPDEVLPTIHALFYQQPLLLGLYAALIIAVTYLVTAARVSPARIAAALAQQGDTISGVAPAQTRQGMDYVFTRTTALVAGYLTAIYLLPEMLIRFFELPFYFGGTSLIVAVIVALDVLSRARGEARKDAMDRF